MENKIKKVVVFVGFFWVLSALCGCTRKEEDMLDEIVFPGASEETVSGSDVAGVCGMGSDEGAETAGDGVPETDFTDREGGSGPEEKGSSGVCYVYICGAVQEPGVYRMEPDDRVFAVIEKAGGFAEGACREYVNQAKPVADGLRIWIPTEEEAEQEGQQAAASGQSGMEEAGLEYPDGQTGKSQDGESAGLVNINTASAAELCSLTGIGEAKARAIIAYRSAHGNFAAKEDIMKVAGIKQNGYDKIKDQITVRQE